MKIGKDSVRIASIDYDKKQIRYHKEFDFETREIESRTEYISQFLRKEGKEEILVFFHDDPESRAGSSIKFVFSVGQWSIQKIIGEFTIDPSKSENNIHQLITLHQNSDVAEKTGYPTSTWNHSVYETILPPLFFELNYEDVHHQYHKVNFTFNEIRDRSFWKSDVNIFASELPIPFKMINEVKKGKELGSEKGIETESSTTTTSPPLLDQTFTQPPKKARLSNSNKSKSIYSETNSPGNQSSLQTEMRNDYELSKILQKHITEDKQLQNRICCIQERIKISSNSGQVKVLDTELNFRVKHEDLKREHDKLSKKIRLDFREKFDKIQLEHDEKLEKIQLDHREKVENLYLEEECLIKQIKDDNEFKREKLEKELKQLKKQKVERDLAALQKLIQSQISSSSSSVVHDPKVNN